MKFLLMFTLMVVEFAQPWKAGLDFDADVDANHNGAVDLAEIEGFFDAYDLNGDDEIPVAEFLEAGGDSASEGFFNLMDPNSDGVITREELPAVLGKFDANGDGTVTKDDFQSSLAEFGNQLMSE